MAAELEFLVENGDFYKCSIETSKFIQISLFDFNVCDNGYKCDLAHIFLIYKVQLLALLLVNISCTYYQAAGHCHTSM